MKPAALPKGKSFPVEAGSPETIETPTARPSKRRWWIVGAVVVVAAAAWMFRAQLALVLPQPIAGWLAPAQVARNAAPPRLVGVAKVTVRPIPVQVSAIGSIDPLRTVNVKSRVDGQVVSVNFKAGDAVKAGQVLFHLDDRPAQAAYEQAVAALAKDTATLENQKREFARQEQLMAAKITTQQDYDAARTAVAVSTQVLVVDKAAIENAKLILDYNTIRAPIGGRTGKVLIDLGNVVKATDTVALVTINQIQPIYATFAVPQRYLEEIRARYSAGRLPVRVTAPDTGTVMADGRLDFVDNAVDSGTGTISLRAIFENEKETLWPGQFVNATLVLHNDPNAIAVPPEAVQTGRDGSFVYVAKEDGTAQYRPVTVDRIVGGFAVITKGLSPDEVVVTDGQLNLLDGSRIQAAVSAPPGQGGGAGGAAPAPAGSNAGGAAKGGGKQ